LFLIAVLVLIGGVEWLKGGLFIAKHEGDTLHLLDIVGRMAAGQSIHRDFMTPIGVLAFLPIVALSQWGLGAGHALIGAQILVAVICLPAIWWVTASRLPKLAAYLAGFYMVLLILSLTYGEADASLSLSMHYNRWAWVLAYLALIPALLPPDDGVARRRAEALDGLVIGLALAALVLLKITYFMAFAVPVAFSLALGRFWRVLIVAVLAGLAVALVATLIGGLEFWFAYAGDLIEVSRSQIRTLPGLSLGNLMGAPAYLGVNLCLLFSVMLLRQAREDRAGLVLLLLFPAFLYVVLQNFGNDPQWLVLLVVLLLALRPEAGVRNGWGWPLREVFTATAVAAMAFALPSFLNIGYSAWRHFWIEVDDYVAMVPDRAAYADLGTPVLRFATSDAVVALDEPGGPMAAYRVFAKRDKLLVEVNGEALRYCELSSGLGAWYQTVAGDLESAGFAGRRLFEADLFNVLWLFGDFPQLLGAAPWYYGGAPGIEDADLVLVPVCAISQSARKGKLDAIAALGVGLREVRRTALYILYEKRPAE
jgi:hypothetical protein